MGVGAEATQWANKWQANVHTMVAHKGFAVVAVDAENRCNKLTENEQKLLINS